MSTNHNDSTPEEVGNIICQAHEVIQKFPEEWPYLMRVFMETFESWLQHPLDRNWSLIQEFKETIAQHENKQRQS